MNLLDGYIIYPQLTVAQFMSETTEWEPGLYGIICDDAEEAYNDLAALLINYNALLGRSLNVYNYDSDTLTYYRIDAERFPFNFDRMYRIEWRYRARTQGLNMYPATNQSGGMNLDFLRNSYIANSSYGLVFLSLSNEITGVDKICSQIAYDYTYITLKNKHMKRTSIAYYVYDQNDNVFYRMYPT